MTDHIATVTSYTERGPNGEILKASTTYGTIEVRPPIRVGRSFIGAVLGKDPCLVGLDYQQQNGKRTVFDAESSARGLERRHDELQILAERIMRLANNPGERRTMSEEIVFPEPKLRRVADDEYARQGDGDTYVQPREEDPQEAGATILDLPPVRLTSDPSPVSVPPFEAWPPTEVDPLDLPPVEIPPPVDLPPPPTTPAADPTVRIRHIGNPPSGQPLSGLPWPPEPPRVGETKSPNSGQTSN